MSIGDNYNIYICNDGRVRAYNKNTHSVISYPRILMEENLGRPLMPYEQVHHKDENPLNNDIDNLQIELLGPHQRYHSTKYYDTTAICTYCGRVFDWTAKQQKYFYSNMSRKNGCTRTGPFCSKQCSGRYGKHEQMSRETHAECE